MTDPTPADLLRAAMDAQGVTDNATRAGLAAICMGESNMLGHVETPYTHTADPRIREVFGHRLDGYTDAQLDVLKADPPKFFEAVYGGQWGAQNLGNTQPGDGYKFRGRFGLQETGRGNYTIDAKTIGHPEIVDDPDAALNNPALGMAMCVAYIRRRYRGGGFEAMMACVGNNIPEIAATKRNYYAQFIASGEFAAGNPVRKDSLHTAASPTAPTVPAAGPVLTVSPDDPVKAAYKGLQMALSAEGYDVGTIDGLPGPRTNAALRAWMAR